MVPDPHDDGPDDVARERGLTWAKLLKRVFAVEVVTCPRCVGPMRLVAVVDDERLARKILEHLRLPARAPPRGHPRRPGQQQLALDDSGGDFDSIDPLYND